MSGTSDITTLGAIIGREGLDKVNNAVKVYGPQSPQAHAAAKDAVSHLNTAMSLGATPEQTLNGH